MAHYLHSAMREAYVTEKSMEEKPGGGSWDGGESHRKMLAAMGMS